MLSAPGKSLSSHTAIPHPTIFNFTTSLPSEVSYTRADTVATFRNAAGKLVKALLNQPRFDFDPSGVARGLLIEGARTNKVAIYNAAPVSTSGLTPSGTVSASVISDSSALTSAGLDLVGNGMVFQIQGGSSGGYVAISGATGNTNPHSFSLWARIVSGATGELRTQNLAAGQGTIISGATYQRYKLENKVPSASSNTLCVSVEAGTTLLFILPQLEEATFSSSEIITAGGAATRATDSVVIANLTGKSWWLESKGTMIATYRTYALSATADQYIFAGNNGTSAETLGIRISKTDSSLMGYLRSSSLSLNTLVTTSRHLADLPQVASVCWKANESTIYHGGAFRSATYSGSPNSLSELRIGQRNAAQEPLFGWVSSLAVFRDCLSLPALAHETYSQTNHLFVGAGQSLMVGLFESVQSAGSVGRDSFLKDFGRTIPSLPCLFVNGAKGSTAAAKTSNAIDYWWDNASGTRGPILELFYSRLAAAGLSRVAAIIWAQGEEDSHHIVIHTSRSDYKQAVLAIFADMRRVLGNPIILIQRIGRRSDAYANSVNKGIQTVREVQAEIIAENPTWCFAAAEIYDRTLFDAVHLDDAGYAVIGQRDSLCLKRALGLSANEAALGPKMVSANRSGLTITVQLAHDGAGVNDFTPSSAISGFKFFDGSTPIAVTSASRSSGSSVVLTLASLPVQATQTLYYGYDDMPDISISSVLRDNSPYALPLRTGRITLS